MEYRYYSDIAHSSSEGSKSQFLNFPPFWRDTAVILSDLCIFESLKIEYIFYIYDRETNKQVILNLYQIFRIRM